MIAAVPSTSECSDCLAGLFAETEGQIACEKCAHGTFSQFARSIGCAACLPGQYQRSNGASACASCAEGHYQTEEGKTNCTSCEACEGGTRLRCGGGFEGFCVDCPAGKFFFEEGETTRGCEDCPAGSWCTSGKKFACGATNLFCPANSKNPTSVAIGHYSTPTSAPEDAREAQRACTEGSSCVRGVRKECPAGFVCHVSAVTALIFVGNDEMTVNITQQKLCSENEFVFEGECMQCPSVGADCTDGIIKLTPDYWFNPDHGSITEFWGKREQGVLSQALGIYRCAPGSCKLDGKSKLPDCTEGRQGLLCGVCSEGYYATDISGCEPCPAGANSAGEAVGMFFFVAALAAAAWQAKRKVEERHPKLAASIKEKLPEVLKLLTGLFQILGAFATVLYRVPWPSAFIKITSFISVLALDVFSLPSLRCSSLGSTFYDRFDLHLTSMLVLTGLFVALLFYVYSRHNQNRAKPLKASLVWNIFLPFLFIICEYAARACNRQLHRSPHLPFQSAVFCHVRRSLDLQDGHPDAALP
jgi:hypothetical protein